MVAEWIAGHGGGDAPGAARGGRTLASVALIVLAAFGLPACNAASAGNAQAGARGIQTYRAHGVSFDYPAGWHHAGLPTNVVLGRVRRKLWSTAFAVDQAHWLDVSAYQLIPPAPRIDIGPVPPAVKTVFRRLFKELGGVLQAGPEEMTMGRMPGLLARDTRTDQGSPVGNTVVFAFGGTTEYVLICEHGSGNAAAVVRACGQVIRTFKVSKAE